MKSKHYFVFVAILFFVFSGCVTPEPVIVEKIVEKPVVVERPVPVHRAPDTLMPLTPAILLRLQGSASSIDISRYQFRLMGRIILEREFVESNDGMGEGGAARFENVHVRENITIHDQTEGQAMFIQAIGNEASLFVCFEDDDKNQLVFTAETDNPSGYFYLDYTAGMNNMGEEKGELMYGDDRYKLKYSGDTPPYLLLKLSQRDSDLLTPRVAPGRRIE